MSRRLEIQTKSTASSSTWWQYRKKAAALSAKRWPPHDPNTHNDFRRGAKPESRYRVNCAGRAAAVASKDPIRVIPCLHLPIIACRFSVVASHTLTNVHP